ncbi:MULTISPECIES: hypothetical protein [Aerosakkonema]|uniref:hypothetical protein n=1 Tax=Aerosakkonema TaxID=1246629 RepID=UPI0035BBAFD4
MERTIADLSNATRRQIRSYSGFRCYEVQSEITKLISFSRYHYSWCTSLQREPL